MRRALAIVVLGLAAACGPATQALDASAANDAGHDFGVLSAHAKARDGSGSTHSASGRIR